MCMTKPYMFFSCVIPGPFNPTIGIDVYSQPLIDDLKKLWRGDMTYEVSRKKNFTMRATLMWTSMSVLHRVHKDLFSWQMREKLVGLTVIVGSYLLIMHFGGTKISLKRGK